MKVEIDFDYDLEREKYLPIPLGRLHIGDHIGRLFFSPEGKTILFVDKCAIEDGSIVLLQSEVIGPSSFGFKQS